MLGGVLPLERETELEAIDELVAGAAGGRGALLLVEGAAGIGKSTLLERAEETARAHGLTVLRARGHALERAFGWGVAPWRRGGPRPDAPPAAPPRPSAVVFDAQAE